MKKSINRLYLSPLLFKTLPAQSVLDKYGDFIQVKNKGDELLSKF